MDEFYLYSKLAAYGDFYPLRVNLDNPKEFVKWTEEKFQYVQYNPRKKIARQGLSITSLDGGLSGIPDLDSLKEYNMENNTSYSELDFKIPTPVYNYDSLKNILDPFKNFIFRTHILKLMPGGFFPPHRDIYFEFDSFRLIIPLDNINPPGVNFVLEDKILNWKKGTMYFVNTAKTHCLFNASNRNSYWLVVNVKMNVETFHLVSKNLSAN